MKIHRMTHLIACFSCLAFFLSACKEPTTSSCLTKVVDLKGDLMEVWDLKYDEDDRLVEYGDTPIEYGKGRITVGGMEWGYRGECMHDVTYFLTHGKVNRSETHCLLKHEGEMVEAWKKTYYKSAEDTLYIVSHYYVQDAIGPVKSMEATYIYDEENRLSEILSVYYDAKGEEYDACHCYYGYDANICYVSNLNLLAFVVDREGLDTFFYLLLNLSGRKLNGSLPNQIRHCVNRGEATYTADGLYRLAGYTPTKAEVVSLRSELKARFEFEHSLPD